jgi:membrane-anchored mycosin MYCP
MRRLLHAFVVALLALGSVLYSLAVSGPAQAADDIVDAECESIRLDVTDPVVTRQESRPFGPMDVDDAQALLARRHQVAGQGVVVAVIDSGVAATPGIPVIARRPVAGATPASYFHGTAVAGLIAGQPRADDLPVGIAPGARILDVQVYDDPDAQEGSDGVPVRAGSVAAGLDQVIAALPTMNVKVVNISLAIPHSPAVRQRIRTLWKAGVIVVAPTGNRPEPGDDNDALGPEFDAYQPGEDAAKVVHPASYPHVVAVNASMTGTPAGTDATDYVMENSHTMVAAPTSGAVSYTVTGGTCLLTTPATSWAAAEVSGMLAMLQSVYDESPARAVRRLLTTASGRPDIPNTLVGAGEVNAYAALTRPLSMDERGQLDPTAARDEPQRVEAPEAQPDLLAATRRNAVWWGLLCGGVLLLALVLRPVLARRRH